MIQEFTVERRGQAPNAGEQVTERNTHEVAALTPEAERTNCCQATGYEQLALPVWTYFRNDQLAPHWLPSIIMEREWGVAREREPEDTENNGHRDWEIL